MNRRLLPGLVLSAVLVLIPARAAVAAQPPAPPLLDYRTQSWFLGRSPGVQGGPAAGLFNPAAFALNDRAGADLWFVRDDTNRDLTDYGLALGRGLNFAVDSSRWGAPGDTWRTTAFQLGLAGGSRRATAGLAYRWTTGATDRTPRQKALVAGVATRPDLRTSFGASAAWSVESGAAQYVFDLGLRPLGRDWLTLFADWTVEDGVAFFRDGGWGAGAEIRPLRFLSLGARVRQPRGGGDPDWTALVALTFDGTSSEVLPSWDADGNRLRSAVTVRTAAPAHGLVTDKTFPFKRPKTYYQLDLQHKVITYQKYRYLDDRRVAWLDLLKLLDLVRDDPTIDGLAVNLAGTSVRPSLQWELRSKLADLRAHGKEVIVHGDRFTPLGYYAATGADRITIDPWGMVAVPGFALARSYLKGTLDKLGLGFEEFRYFRYKSAAETFSRDTMSEADREQRQRIVDVLYAAVLGGVAERRGLAQADVDSLVDRQALLTADEALQAGLVDAVARWDDLGKWLRENRGARLVGRLPRDRGRAYWDEQWGDADLIPVVYAVGSTSMDSGIKGRTLSAYLRGLVHDPRVKAVVLRADSPGGDVLPSDLVADAVRKLKAAGKPVIVSQGDVAASGGYWISMDGTRILTTPLTITGSIGVIGGWLWDDGFAGKLGITSAAVSKGRHADLMTTVNLPFLGGIPRRALTDDELAHVKRNIVDDYNRFVAAVAVGRGMTPAAVDSIAQGRVWMGGDAIARGLCDGFGTLDQAIADAREAAGIPAWRDVQLVEYPPRPLIELPSLLPRLPSLFGLGDRVNDWVASAFAPGADDAPAEPLPLGAPGLSAVDVEYLQSLAASPGRPLAFVPTDALPGAWQQAE